jgi:hypothetical protein
MTNNNGTFKFIDRKVIIRIKGRVCETPEELMTSDLFYEVVRRFVADLARKDSPLLKLFDKPEPDESDVHTLIQTFLFAQKIPLELVPKLVENSDRFVIDPYLLYNFVERLYDYWREFERFVVCDSTGDELDKRPYRTFNATIGSLMHLIRGVYRDIQENVTGKHPDIYRQVRAGAEVAVIILPKELPYLTGPYQKLAGIPLIRQILLYPPLLLNPPMNKRSGQFERIDRNPLELVEIQQKEWLCYPAKVGSLLVLVYFHERFFELGFALCNLFELADDEFLQRKADAVYLFGVPGETLDTLADFPTVFYDDSSQQMLAAAVPGRDEFGYFGYLKKMILTLHNVQVMKMGRMPYHGAMVRIVLAENKVKTILIIGDTGAGKSETLEAFRTLGQSLIKEMTIIADDMGSLEITGSKIKGYGTEVGAFIRLDDLQAGYAFGQLDRTIIMSPSQVNARVVMPVTTYAEVVKGYEVDMMLYANNYEQVDETQPIIEKFDTPEAALSVFKEGVAMSKGTTTSTGLVSTYFVNVFGPIQYQTLHDEIAERYFDLFFSQGIFVGQLRTRLGVPGWERTGPEEAARELLKVLAQEK